MGQTIQAICIPTESSFKEKKSDTPKTLLFDSNDDINIMDDCKKATEEQAKNLNHKFDEFVAPIFDGDTLLTEFEKSIINKDFDNAMALIESYPDTDFVNYELSNGDKCLIYAVREKNSRFSYYLLQSGADPDVQSKLTGDTALHVATKNEDPRMITLLMRFKADIDIANGEDLTPIDIAEKLKNQDIIEMYAETFQTFLRSHDPTVRDYGARHSVHFGKYDNSSAQIKSAFYVEGQSQNLQKNNKKKKGNNPNKKDSLIVPGMTMKRPKRKLWKPVSMKNLYSNDSDDDKSDDEYEDGDFEDWDSDDEPEPSQVKKAHKLLGASENEIKNEHNVGDILGKLKLKREKSKALVKIIEKVADKKDKLPVLKSWLEKKRYKPPYFYQKRYLMVIDGYLLWHDKKVRRKPGLKLDKTEKKKYSGSLSLLLVKDIKVKEYPGYPAWWEFEFSAPNAKLGGDAIRIYNWKCKTEQLRDDWVKGIQVHVKALKNELNSFDKI